MYDESLLIVLFGPIALMVVLSYALAIGGSFFAIRTLLADWKKGRLQTFTLTNLFFVITALCVGFAVNELVLSVYVVLIYSVVAIFLWDVVTIFGSRRSLQSRLRERKQVLIEIPESTNGRK